MLIRIAPDLHKTPEPEPRVTYQVDQHAYLLSVLPRGWFCGTEAVLSASTCGDRGFFSVAIGRAAVAQRERGAVRGASEWFCL